MQHIQQALADLSDIGGEELVHDVVEMFMADAPLRLSEAKAAVQVNDAKAAMRSVHSLKSTAAQLGLLKLSATCAAMESEAQAGNLTRLSAQLAEAEVLSVAASDQLRVAVRLAA